MIFSAPHASFLGWEPLPDPTKQDGLRVLLESWEGTRYQAGAQCKGAGVDCVRFVCGVLDELTGQSNEIAQLPADACFHSPSTALRGAQNILDLYPCKSIDTASQKVMPGDILMTGPRNGGPGHAMIVGCQRGVLWHSTHPNVHKVGLSAVFLLGHKIFGCYRLLSLLED